MKAVYGVLVGAALLAIATVSSHAASLTQPCFTTTGQPLVCTPTSDTTPLPVTGSFSPSGTQNVNVTAVGGNAVTTTVPVSVPGSVQVQGLGAAGSPLGGVLSVQGVSGGTPEIVQGPAASGAAASGNPVLTGAVAASAAPSTAAGNILPLQADTGGNLRVTPSLNQGTATNGFALSSSAFVQNPSRSAVLLPMTGIYNFNGTAEDLAFTCPSSAVVNVTAGNTTQIVALSGTTQVRVCSFSVSASIAGTATFVYGTGTNCAAGTTSLTGAMPLATGVPWTVSSGAGSVLRTAAANALCVTAVTGNVVGFVTYAQF